MISRKSRHFSDRYWKTRLAGWGLIALFCFMPMALGEPLADYEKAMLGRSYPDAPMEERLSRLESLVFGETQKGDLSSRESRLTEILSKTVPTAQSQTPVYGSDTANTDRHQNFSNFQPSQQPVQPSSAPRDINDYPTVNAMEQQVFGRKFLQDDLSIRLTRLEQKVFNKTYPQMALVDRVDKLVQQVPSAGIYSTSGWDVQFPNSTTTSSPAVVDRGQPSSASQWGVYGQLDELERTIYRGQPPAGGMLSERLDGLEKRAFGKAYSGESLETRMNRLMEYTRKIEAQTAYNGGPPPIQPREPVQPAPSSGGYYATPGPNIGIGAGISSTTTQQYSPELLNMLPNDVRSQFQGGNSATVQSSRSYNTPYGTQKQRSSTTYYSNAPGTVITEESTQYPGFTTYGNQPLQYRNYYSPPAQVTRRTYVAPGSAGPGYGTTSPQYGSSQPYQEANPYYSAPVPQSYSMDPAVLQQLDNLEINVFGGVNPYEPIPVRLSRLEMKLTGQMYNGYSDEERIQNLQRTHQAQSLGKVLGKGTLGKVGRTAGSVLLGVPMQAPPVPNGE